MLEIILEDGVTYQNRPGSSLKVTTVYNVSKSPANVFEENVTTYQMRLGDCLKKAMQRIKSVSEFP